jgi:hypothetical protein
MFRLQVIFLGGNRERTGPEKENENWSRRRIARRGCDMAVWWRDRLLMGNEDDEEHNGSCVL